MNEQGTYIKLYRSIIDNPLFQNDLAFRVWIYLLCTAAYKDTKKYVNGQIVFLKKGQAAFTVKQLAQIFGTTRGKIRKVLQIFEFNESATIKSTNKFTLATIVNWGFYQLFAEEKNQQNNHQTTIKQPSNNQQLIYNYNYNNNIKNKEIKNIYTHTSSCCSSNSNVECIEHDDNDDISQEQDSFEYVGGIGKGVVLLTQSQMDLLIDRLGIDGFNYYIEKLADFIIKKDAKVKNHYATILKWVDEDSNV